MNSDISSMEWTRDYTSSQESNGTISDKILNNLTELSKATGQKVLLENSDRPIQTYHYGQERAKIVKRLHDATVGEDGGKIRYYAEVADVRSFPWWQTVLQNLPIYFLELPVDYLAAEAGTPHPEHIFSPEHVTSHYKLNPKADRDRQIACVQWVQDQVVKVLGPKLSPDFQVMFLEGHFRLIPLTLKAQESRFENNEAYNKAKLGIQEAIKPLQATYERMSQKSS